MKNVSVEKRFDNEVNLWSDNKTNDIISWERRKRLKILEQMLNNLPKARLSILEIGCGAGVNISKIAASNPDWDCVGVDISGNMINYCKKKFKNIRNLEFQQLDIDRKCMHKKFDVIILLGVIGYVNNNKAFKNIDSMLKRNGFLYFTYGNKSSPFRLVRNTFSALLDRSSLFFKVYNFVKCKIMRSKYPYDSSANNFKCYYPSEILIFIKKYNVIEKRGVCFSSGTFGPLSVYFTRFIEIFIKKDRLNLAMTKIIYARKNDS